MRWTRRAEGRMEVVAKGVLQVARVAKNGQQTMDRVGRDSCDVSDTTTSKGHKYRNSGAPHDAVTLYNNKWCVPRRIAAPFFEVRYLSLHHIAFWIELGVSSLALIHIRRRQTLSLLLNMILLCHVSHSESQTPSQRPCALPSDITRLRLYSKNVIDHKCSRPWSPTSLPLMS